MLTMEDYLRVREDFNPFGQNGRKRSEDDTVLELGEISAEEQKFHVPGHEHGGHDHNANGAVRPGVYTNTLTPRQMESLTALCNTFLPPLEPPSRVAADEAIAKFYRTSASMTGAPELLGGLVSQRMEHPKLWLMKLTLWLLSTWIGTFILCGLKSMSREFPYFRSFPQLPLKRREEIIMSWSNSGIIQLRMFARAMKLLALLTFFTLVDEKDDNPSWKAIGYCGPDPEFKKQLHRLTQSSSPSLIPSPPQPPHAHHQDLFGPLHPGLIQMSSPRDAVANSLQRLGFPVSVCPLEYNPTRMPFPSLSIQCDAVVVGSGSGGGLVAGVLAKAGYRVLVLEKGNYCARTNLSLLEGPSMDQMYLQGGLLATANMGTLVLAGSTVGGGSAVNWSASIRTPQHVIEEWSNVYGLELFDSKLYTEALDVVCKRMGVQSEISKEGFHNAVLRKGCNELGYPVRDIPRNSSADHYCGWCCLGCRDGRKKGTLETWLVDLVDSGNGAILPGCEGIQVLHCRKDGWERNVATGVAFEFHCNGMKEICVVESKVTVVACGSLSTPALLLRSGLKNPNIGRNLHLHPVAMAWGHFPDSNSLETWPESEQKSYEGGIMTAMSTVVGNIETSGYGAVIQTPALHPGMFSVLIPWVSGMDFKARMCKFSRTAHIFALARDKGSGTVLSRSSIDYKLDEVDEKNLQRGLEKLLRILAAAGAHEIGTHHSNGKMVNVKVVSSHAFERFVKEESSRPLRDLSTPICSAHQMGSCRMGTGPKRSAVSPVGETWEVEGLYVADASVFPTALGVNPMVTCQAIAYCTAQSVLEVLGRKKYM
ncbi:hypothetical protein MLD38_039080 [Melastoma candidum]|uniref:Uncharacterized protein n=1 Tax=Melastoma candidum TaxID=119954 RepID=A0ACB9L1D1_9MYRT|nr:hypothetical protein MLD38_039080 [Melastoma candidum]